MSSSQLTLLFVNQTGLPDNEVFITFENPSTGSTNFDVTYDAGNKAVSFAAPANIMSNSLDLQTVGSGGFAVTTLTSGIIFVSYGAALTSTTSSPSYIGSGGADYNTAYQPFELTRTGGDGDQGDLTAINYFTAPMSIQSYNGGRTGTLLQSVGYQQTAAQIAASIGALTGNDPASVITNSSGDIVRYIGPSSYGAGDSDPFPSLVPYMQSVNAANQATTISNSNAFNVPASAGAGSTNYNFTLNLTATMGSDGTITMTGDITTTIIPYGKPSTAGPTFADCGVIVSAAAADAFNFTLYGQAIGPAVWFGSGWTALGSYMESVGLCPQGALSTTQNLAIGEISSGVLMGFVNSSTIPAGSQTALKDMPSGDWWKLDPVVAFSQVQSNPAYYNQYGNVLYLASGNEVYSIPYSDRLGTGPLINSVQFNGTEVDTWVVTLQPPVPSTTG